MRIEQKGDRALIISFDEAPSDGLTTRLIALAAAARDLPGVIDSAPGHRTVLVEVGAGQLAPVGKSFGRLARSLLASPGPRTGEVRRHRVEIEYDGEDFDWACDHLGIGRDELARLHSSRAYTVRLIGSPGFIYLSEVVPELALPRLYEHRTEVAAGSVGIAGKQTGIYGRARPGGWRILGTVAGVPDVRPGDRIDFIPR